MIRGPFGRFLDRFFLSLAFAAFLAFVLLTWPRVDRSVVRNTDGSLMIVEKHR